MKAESNNTWTIVRWALVALIYAGTLAIAIDPVKTRDKRISEFITQETHLKEMLSQATAERDQALASARDWKEKHIAGLESHAELIVAVKELQRAEKTVADLKGATP